MNALTLRLALPAILLAAVLLGLLLLGGPAAGAQTPSPSPAAEETAPTGTPEADGTQSDPQDGREETDAREKHDCPKHDGTETGGPGVRGQHRHFHSRA